MLILDGLNLSHFFADCRPKFTKLRTHVWE